MPKYLIEVPHSDKREDCEMAIRVFLTTGSHFLTNAEWGCLDGEHKAWFILETENREQARSILPPAFRPQARVIALNRFTLNDEDEIMPTHTG